MAKLMRCDPSEDHQVDEPQREGSGQVSRRMCA